MKAISHPLRLKILCVLGEQEVNVQEIVDAVGTSQSNISQHLAVLREKGIIGSRKDANRVFYSVRDQRTLQLIGLMREVFCGDPRVPGPLWPTSTSGSPPPMAQTTLHRDRARQRRYADLA